jgi:hypothetical protein
MSDKDIFISQTEATSDISNKLTYTNILQTIPPNKVTDRNIELLNNGKTEWRWRFLKFENRFVTEISYLKKDMSNRLFFNKNGQWIEREIDPIYDEYVVETYYYYTDN